MRKRAIKNWIKWRKGLVLVGYSVLILVLIAIIAGFVLQYKLPKLLKAAVEKNTEGLYKLTFDNPRVSILRGRLALSNAHLQPDTLVYGKLVNPPASLFDLRLKEMDCTGFGIVKFLLTKKIKITNIQLIEPAVIRRIMFDKKEKKKGNWLESLPRGLQNGKVGHFSVKALRFKTERNKHVNKGGWLENINLDVNNLWLNKKTREDTSYCWFAKNIRLSGDDVRYTSDDGLYEFRMARLNTSTAEKMLHIDSLLILPKYTEAAWSKSLPYKRDRYDMVYPEIKVKGIGFKQLEQEGRLPVDLLEINKALIRIYADKGMPEHTTIAANNFPSLAFQRLKLPITVKHINLNNADLYYKERNPKSGKAGTVAFKKLNGQLTNVSNDTIQLRQQAWVNCHFTTYFLGKPKLTLDLSFNMRDTTGAFNYKGALTGAPASVYNQILEPLTLARAEKGYIHAIRFAVKANRFGASVKTEMLYNDFKLALLDANSGELQKKGFLSLFINWLAIKSDNPSKKDEAPRIAQHYYEHSQEKTFFNLMWKAVYSGLKVNLGLPKN